MHSRKVLLVGWDAADWKVIQPLIAAGKMPNLQRLVETGAHGPIATLHPALSPMLWTSIATGKRPFKHGIHGFAEPAPDGQRVQPVSSLSRKTKALWNILNQNDLRSIVIGWWPSHPAEPIDGVMVSNHYQRAHGPIEDGWPLLAHAVHPPELAGKLADLRVHPDSLTAETVECFIPLAREINQDTDHRLALFLRILAECMSVHSAAAWLIENQPWDFCAVYYDAIDHFCHGFMRYHPPQQSWIGDRDFELYRNVVSAGYQLHDQMLGALIEKSPDDTTVVLLSDHGFHPDHLRVSAIPAIPAGPVIEHRDHGVIVLNGSGIGKNKVLHGSSLLDIVPTVLQLYGLPIGEDMDGKVLSEAMVSAPQSQFIPSWDEVPGRDGSHPRHARLDPVASHEAMQQMIALGYIEPLDENSQTAVAKTIRELRYNLGESYQDAGRHAEAYEIFRELYKPDSANSDDYRFAVRLFVSCQALGLHEEMRRIVDDLNGQGGHQPLAGLLEAQLLAAENRHAEALATLEKITDPQLLRPALFLQKGDLYLRLKQWRKADQMFREALAIDPDNAQAHAGLCRIALRKRNFEAAVQSALSAVELSFQDPQPHFFLGVALSGLNQFDRAAEAFRTAIALNPNFPEAHFQLAKVLAKNPRDAESAREHRQLARGMRSSGSIADMGAAPVSSTLLDIASARENGAGAPPLSESVIIVSGLPRSGTSMLMQMLAAGGVSILSDETRGPDEDNPRGYLEFEPVKKLRKNSRWLLEARGKAVKIVAPLLSALPPGLPCRVIICERDFEEMLDSQERMLRRNNQPPTSPERRRRLMDEYVRTLDRTRAMLSARPLTETLVVRYDEAISRPLATAEALNEFLGGALMISKMVSAIDPALHRNRAAPLGA